MEGNESVIMAGLLGLDPKFLLNESRKGEGIDHWSELLYERLDSFPAAVLYNTKPKLETPGLHWAPRTLRIPYLLAHAVRPIPDHEGHRPGEEYGKIQSAAFDFGGYAILFSLPQGVEMLPGSFRVLLDESRCSTACHYVPQLLLHFKIRKTEIRERTETGEVGNRPANAPQRTVFRELGGHGDVEKETDTQFFALIIRRFSRHYVVQEDYVSAAAILRVTKGAKSYLGYCSNTLGDPLVRRAPQWLLRFDPFAKYLRGS